MLKRLSTRMKKSRLLRITVIVLGCTLLAALFILGIFSNFGALLGRSTPFPINLHSAVQANYQKDPDYMQIPPMDIQLVIDAIRDSDLDSQHLSLRLTQVDNNFLSSVASVTPQPTVSQDTVTATLELTPSSSPTITSVGFIPSPTATIPTATATHKPSAPTDTPPAPTDTPLPPTSTPLPPTNTPDICSQTSLSFHSTTDLLAKWRVTNNSNVKITITSLQISWPSANEDLIKIQRDGLTFWTGEESPPSAAISSWVGGGHRRTIQALESSSIKFEFDKSPQSSGYSLTLNFNNGCSLSNSH